MLLIVEIYKAAVVLDLHMHSGALSLQGPGLNMNLHVCFE